MGFMGRMGSMWRSVLEADAGHALAEAALLYEFCFEAGELLVDEVVRLVDETERDICDGLGGPSFDKFPEILVAKRRLFSKLADVDGFFGSLGPDFEITRAEEVVVVVQQFFKAGPGDVGQLNLGFLGGEGGFAAFENVLFSGARGLDHLIDRAVAFGQKLVGEAEGDVVNDFGFLKGEQGSVIAARWEEAFGGGLARMGELGIMRIMGGMGIMSGVAGAGLDGSGFLDAWRWV